MRVEVTCGAVIDSWKGAGLALKVLLTGLRDTYVILFWGVI